MLKWVLALLMVLILSAITDYVRYKYQLEAGDMFFDLIPFVSGWWCYAIIENIK